MTYDQSNTNQEKSWKQLLEKLRNSPKYNKPANHPDRAWGQRLVDNLNKNLAEDRLAQAKFDQERLDQKSKLK